jgi:hypothetical protein
MLMLTKIDPILNGFEVVANFLLDNFDRAIDALRL